MSKKYSKKQVQQGQKEIKQYKSKKDGSFHLEFLNSEQKQAFELYQKNDIIFLLGPAGSGKALTLDSVLYKKDGPIKMKDVKVGDEIANPDGNFSKVTGVFPQGIKDVYRIYFSDQTHIDCCEDHLWLVNHCDNGWKNKVVTTSFIKKNCKRSDGKRLLSITCTNPVNFDRKNYYISPYLMGIILSEGSVTGSNLVFTTCEKEIYQKVTSELDENYCCKTNFPYDHRIVKKEKSNLPNMYKDELKRLNVWNKKSYEKFIPKEYLHGSVDQRISLLQGLMDGDGYVSKKGSVSYCSTSSNLINDVIQLVLSLGGSFRKIEKTGSLKENGERYRKSFICTINLPDEIKSFYLNRKKLRLTKRKKYFPKKYIDRVEVIGKKEMQCISVNHNRSLYLTDNYTVTHNTHLAAGFGIASVLTKEKSKLILSRPVVEAGEHLGHLPGPQPLDAKVLTPNGWKTMGETKIGDEVIGRDGIPTKVLGVYPKGEKDTYKVTTFDGTSTTCCVDHLWYTKTKEEKNEKKQGKIRVTKDIICDLKNGIKHFIPRNEAVHFNKKDLPISPYTLGVLLGDGCVTSKHVRFVNADQEIVDRVNDEIKEIGLYCQKAKKQYSKACVYTLSSTEGFWEGSKPVKITDVNTKDVFCFPRNKNALEFAGCKYKTLATRIFGKRTVNGLKYEKYGEPWRNPVLKFLKDYDLHGKKAWEKFIPDNYKYSSIKDRIDVIRGLLDTDGACRLDGGVKFYTTSFKLAEDVVEIIRSLGGKAKLKIRDRRSEKNRNIVARRVLYVISISMPKEINPFFLKRKAERFKGKNVSNIEITSIEKIGHEKVQCIKVDNPEHLYLTDNFIVTHNTFEEKIAPYLIPLMHCFDDLVGKDSLNRELLDNNLEFLPIAYCRGITFKNCVAILDEAQNATKTQIKLFLTRLGMNAKVIITGDPFQTDIGPRSGLMEVVDSLKDINGIGIMQFSEKAIVRHPLIPEILKKI